MIKTITDLFALSEVVPTPRLPSEALWSPDRQEWENARYLYRVDDTREIWCPCGEGGFVDVVWRVDPEGTRQAYRCCPFCGSEPISVDSVQGWGIDSDVILADFAAAISFDPPKTDIPGISWSLGRRRRKQFIYIRLSDKNAQRSIRQKYARCTETVFIVSKIEQIKQCQSFTDNCVVAFEQLLTWENGRIIFDRECFDAFFIPEDENIKTKEQRKRQENIKKLKDALKLYAQAALDTVQETGRLGRVQVPERPNQAYFAQATHLSQQSVSRYLREDPILNYLWKNLDTVEDIEGLKEILSNPHL